MPPLLTTSRAVVDWTPRRLRCRRCKKFVSTWSVRGYSAVGVVYCARCAERAEDRRAAS
jgi:hypothetical protein